MLPHRLIYRFKEPIMQILYGENGLHAFGYNSAESEPIWMKYEALEVHWWGVGPADFGRDLRSSDSLRGSRIVLSGK